MWKSVLQFKLFIFIQLVLASAATFAVEASKPKIVTYQNIYIFRIEQEAYSLKQLKATIADLSEMTCIIDKSLLLSAFELSRNGVKRFADIPADWALLDKDTENKRIFAKVRNLMKLEAYLRTKDVKFRKGLFGTLREISNLNDCDHRLFTKSGKPVDSLKHWLKLEIFLRQKIKFFNFDSYAPAEDLVNLRAFWLPIEKQIGHEDYWQ